MNSSTQVQTLPELTLSRTTIPEVYFHRITVLQKSPRIRIRLQCFFENAANETLSVCCGFFLDEPYWYRRPNGHLAGGRRKCVIVGTSERFTLADGMLYCQTIHTPRSDSEFRNDIEVELPLDELDKSLECKTVLWPSSRIFCQLCAFWNDESITAALPFHLVLDKYQRECRTLILPKDAPKKQTWWRRAFFDTEIF